MTKPLALPHAEKARIVVVDDHPIVRDYLKQLINYQPDLVVCAEAAEAGPALQAVARFNPSVVITDLALKNGHGLELIKDLRLLHPAVRVLVLSMYHESLWAERALRAGALGYIMKEEITSQMIVAIRRVLGGQVYLSDSMAARALSKLAGLKAPVTASPPVEAQLSDRELEVFRMLGSGHGPSEIAVQLHVNVKTVESYRARIREKLRLRDAAELRRQAIAWVHNGGAM
jgi:DNA-binding NarL/FixJ family response regulator